MAPPACERPSCDQEPAQRCGRCRAARYCSRDCQRADWKRHRAVCAAPPAAKAEARDAGPKGRGLFATADAAPGEALLAVPCTAAVVATADLAGVCGRCFKRQARVECAACEIANYCGRECHGADAPVHERECVPLRALQRVPFSGDREAVRLAIRVICRRRELGGWSAAEAAEMAALVAHERRASAAQREAATEAAQLAWCLTEDADEPEPLDAAALVALLLRIKFNAFPVCDDRGRPAGTGLFPLAAAANHSCAPSAVAVADGRRLLLRAARPVAAGEELTIAYVDPFQARNERRALLQAGYRFACACERCSLPLDPADAAACGDCGAQADADGRCSVAPDAHARREPRDAAAALTALQNRVQVAMAAGDWPVLRAALDSPAMGWAGPGHRVRFDVLTALAAAAADGTEAARYAQAAVACWDAAAQPLVSEKRAALLLGAARGSSGAGAGAGLWREAAEAYAAVFGEEHVLTRRCRMGASQAGAGGV